MGDFLLARPVCGLIHHERIVTATGGIVELCTSHVVANYKVIKNVTANVADDVLATSLFRDHIL